MSGYVYILKSLKNDRYYIGSTNNIFRRLTEHNSSKCKYTSESGPWEIVFSQEFETIKLARHIEYMLKKLKSKKVVEMIIVKKKLFVKKKEM